MARILIIEDSAVSMKLTTFLVQIAGHTVLCAVDAETGVKLVRTAKPDLILMDILLPGMDGLAATALLKADPTTAAIPIIVLTSLMTKADERNAFLAGCNAYIVKPLARQKLQAAIEDLLHASIDNFLPENRPYTATTEPRH